MMGSDDSCGLAPCAPAPVSSMSNESAAAASGPASATTWPTSKRRSTCPPNIAAAPSSAPDSIITCAPAPVSSAGCNTTITSPSAGSAARRCAAPTAHVACTSWPHACITPALREAKGRPVSSWIGSASMSPRTATGGAEALRPRMRAITPTPVTPSAAPTRKSSAGRRVSSAS